MTRELSQHAETGADFRALLGPAPALADASPAANYVREHFASPAAVGDYVERFRGRAWYRNPLDSADRFYGAPLSTALRQAREGWPEGAEHARKLLDLIQVNQPTRRRLVRHAMAGAVPNVARALAGAPDSMRAMGKSPNAAQPVITLLAGMGGAGRIHGSRFTNLAVALAATVDRLEEAGLRVALMAICYSRAGSTHSELCVALKDPAQPVDIGALAFGLGSETFMRRLVFSMWASMPAQEPIGSTFGTPKSVHADHQDPPGTYRTPCLKDSAMEEAAATPQGALRLLLSDLRAQGCPGLTED
jgi:hypothetical protein